ncbi:ABC transporter substrate-binding protein [Halomonas sp. V046]|uniref:ABC transporter substrate-binding protein n=1 Tax=Halomonas sp. V046 TaxID=3459611 RepID=UPI004043A952
MPVSRVFARAPRGRTPSRRWLPLAGICLLGSLLSVQAQARTLVTGFGDVEIDGEPSRVVTLYEGALDAALAAGVTPLGGVATRGGQDVARYLQASVPDLEIVGLAGEVNVEAVVGLAPDLILASPSLSDATYALLSQLAPTVVPTTEGLAPEAWKQEALLFGEALGRRDRVAEAIGAVETRAESIRAAAQQARGDRVHLVRWMPQGPLVMSTQLFSTGLLSAAGLKVTDEGLVPGGRPHSDPLSLEALSQIDGDWLFLATLNDDGEQALAAAEQTPAFRRLSVVEDDRVMAVDGQLWTSANGPLAAQAVLDDIEAALAGDSAP